VALDADRRALYGRVAKTDIADPAGTQALEDSLRKLTPPLTCAGW
jgi:hypothetical protein